MNHHALRNWGIGVGGAMLAGALGVALLNGEPTTETPQSSVAGPLSPAPIAVIEPPAAPEAEPVFESAAAEAPPASDAPPLSFLVRFDADSPLARAQNLAAAGNDAEARRAAEAALRRQSALRGLCFDRFTLGGAEIVLRPCNPVSAARQEAERRRWLTALNATPGVTYAESNAILNPEAGRTP